MLTRDNFIDGRPYPPTGMTTLKWRRVLVTNVRIDLLKFTQDGVLLRGLLLGEPHMMAAADIYPHVVEWEGTFYLEDGHTRVARAYLQGAESVPARLLHVVERDDETAGAAVEDYAPH